MPKRSSHRYGDAERIRPAERDRALELERTAWPQSAPAGWEAGRGFLHRTIGADTKEPKRVPAALEELVLRFPSAPLHGLQRLHEHHITLEKSENFHTLRVLRSADARVAEQAVSRIFLMHPGLNERDRIGLYYRLASQFIMEEPTTVCILRPFPGHLTRYPFQAFAETPLDNYLWDGSHLFRQFLRYMLETQWFLSAVTRRSSYRCASGANLLGEHETVEESRLDATVLGQTMLDAWLRLQDASSEIAEAELRNTSDQDDRPAVNPHLPELGHFVDDIATLRTVLNLERYPARSGELENTEPSEPRLHVIGYSLGGFTAQSVFMSWPFLISSCSTLLAGGALRELAPTGFADPEEWQTVLHSLRYELDDRLMSKHVGVTADSVAGIDLELFTYFKRTFYEVFQQEYRGSIQTRLEAFRERMLFIVGGDDPVVRPESVLQSGPKGGLNLLEIGGLGHFLEGEGRSRSEKQQRAFWLPEMAALIHRFSNSAAQDLEDQRLVTWFDADLAEPAVPREAWNAAFGAAPKEGHDEHTLRKLLPTELIAIEHDGALPGELFERSLDDLLYRVSVDKDGVLFVLRNEVPTFLLPPSAVRETAAALYHDDFGIVRYCHGVAARREVLESSIDRICVVLPWNAGRIMRRMDLHRGFPSQAESAGGLVATRLAPEGVWEHSLKTCYALAKRKEGRESIRRFDGNEPFSVEPDGAARLLEFARRFTHDKTLDSVPSLPDSWIWASTEFLAGKHAKKLDAEGGIRGLIGGAPTICDNRDTILEAIRDESIRIVTVSRARYNPRFRGRLIVDGSVGARRLLHAALCLSQSTPIGALKPAEAFPVTARRTSG
jgi:pimeloyl-ACP methyl ester carboxylesterase